MKTWTKSLLCLCVVLFALALLLPNLSTGAVAAELGEDSYWSFQEESGVLTISGSGEMPSYSYFVGYCPPWEDLLDKITEVVVSEGITSISSDAFAACKNLTRVTLPSTLTTIHSGAFWYCESLKNISIPKNVSRIESNAWDHCTNLEEILVDPENPYYTSQDGILYNKAMTELLRCPEAWKGTLSIPEGVQRLELRAFYLCNGLTEVRLPSSVQKIDYDVFFNCTSLKHADLSALSCEFDPAIFAGCSSLEWITLPKTNPCYKQDAQGALYNQNMSCLVFCPGGYSGNFVVPFGVKEIGANAFAGCAALKAVTIPATVEAIRENAFTDCAALECVVMAEGVKTIGAYAFERCFSLKSVELPHSVETIEGGAFWYCTSLQNIVMHHGVKSIDCSAFEGCESLGSVMIPDSVTYMGENMFAHCTALTTAILPAVTEWTGDDIFLSCENMRDVYFRGTAPSAESFEYNWCLYDRNRITLHYVEGQEGWTSPSWDGFITQVWSGNVATDIAPSDYFYPAVQWAMENGITNGVGNDLFKPEDSCTRGQIVTFLWRAAGCPEPLTTESPFTDTFAEEYYYKAVLWAAEQGITNGVGDGLFSPEETCTRAQAATFLWRAQGEPTPESQAESFTDVPTDTYYTQAVLWAAEQGITNGVGEGRFAPEEQCTRGQIVTFLWRTAGTPDLSPYCPVIQAAMEPPTTDASTKEALLCDMDGDGVQELILMYYEGNQTLCDVYTIRNGEALALLKGEKIYDMKDSDLSECGVAEIDGNLYFYTLGTSFEVFYHSSNEYTMQEAETWKFYSLENGELPLVSEVNYIRAERFDGTSWKPSESCFTVNGETVPSENYTQWRDSVTPLRKIDGEIGYVGDYEGYALDELLRICQAF